MQQRHMGDSELAVSAIGFGCWELGGTYGAFDERETTAAIHRAIDLGVNLFDTARFYGFTTLAGESDPASPTHAGQSEELLGRALGARRQEILLVTKGGLPTRAGQLPRRDSRYQSIVDDCEASLRALGTDYIDLYLIHWPDPATPLAETMGALTDLAAAGKVRQIGVSNFNAAQLRESRALAPIVANQVGYNLFDRRWEREMFATAAELGVGIMAYGPLAHGLLTGTFTADTTFAASDWRAHGVIFGQALFRGDNFRRNLAVVERLKALAARKGVGLPRLALAWVLGQPQVAVALTGARNQREIEDNVAALDLALSPDERAAIDAIMADAAGQVDAVPA